MGSINRQFAQVTFTRFPSGQSQVGEKIIEYKIAYPRNVIERRIWVLNWIQAIIQCKYPKHFVDRSWYFYYDKPIDELKDLKTSLSSAKAMVTKIQNAIFNHVRHEKATNLFFNKNEDKDLQKAFNKLRENRSKVRLIKNKIKSLEANNNYE